MARIIESTEEHGFDKIVRMKTNPKTVGGAVTKAAVEIGEVIGAKFLIIFTETGGSATRMARIRPRLPMLAFTSEPRVRSRLALVWGIETYLVPRMHHTDQFAMQVDLKLIPEGRVSRGRPRRHRRRLAPRHPRLDERTARAPGRRRRQPCGPGLPAGGGHQLTGRSEAGRAARAPMLARHSGRGGGMADTGHSKCSGRKVVRVRVPPSALSTRSCPTADATVERG